MNKNIEGVLTFFYYNHLEEASNFYKNVMKFNIVLDRKWVKIFHIQGTSHLGIVDKERGSHQPSEDKPVRLQVMVSDADSWFRYLKDKGVFLDRERPHVGKELNIKAFSIHDPEGYTIEICEYTTPYGE